MLSYKIKQEVEHKLNILKCDKDVIDLFQDWIKVSDALNLSDNQFQHILFCLFNILFSNIYTIQDIRMLIGLNISNTLLCVEKAVNELGYFGDNSFFEFRTKSKEDKELTKSFFILFSKYIKETYRTILN